MGHPNSTMRVEADNPQQAMDNFLKICGNPLSSEVSVNEWNENSRHRTHETSTKDDNSNSLEDSSGTLEGFPHQAFATKIRPPMEKSAYPLFSAFSSG
jgi:hypothetical protein